MIEFYNVTFIDQDKTTSQVICVQDSLFRLLWIFEHSEKVVVFEVSRGNNLVLWTDFGWGKFNKWVNKFTQEHYNEK